MSGGRLFQSRLPAAVKARSPTVTSLVVGMMTSSDDDDHQRPMASSHPAWSYWSDATVLDDYEMTTTTTNGRTRPANFRCPALDLQLIDVHYRSANQADSAFHPFGVDK